MLDIRSFAHRHSCSTRTARKQSGHLLLIAASQGTEGNPQGLPRSRPFRPRLGAEMDLRQHQHIRHQTGCKRPQPQHFRAFFDSAVLRAPILAACATAPMAWPRLPFRVSPARPPRRVNLLTGPLACGAMGRPAGGQTGLQRLGNPLQNQNRGIAHAPFHAARVGLVQATLGAHPRECRPSTRAEFGRTWGTAG